VAGAFAETLEDWKARGTPIPLLFGHNMSDPDFNIGSVVEATEDDHGLLVRCVLDLENPKAVQVYRLLNGHRVNQMSFAFDVVKDRVTGEKDERVRELLEVRLYEVSVVTLGANQETEIIDVKARAAATMKAGRVLAQKHIDSLRHAQDAIGAVIAAAEATLEEDQGKASGQTVDKDEGPDGVKSTSGGVNPSVSDLATLLESVLLEGELS
jgi:HK97 family phage prohead protease